MESGIVKILVFLLVISFIFITILLQILYAIKTLAYIFIIVFKLVICP